MDLNQLLFQHQVALMNLAKACDLRSSGDAFDTSSASRFDLVRHYERRIARLRTDLGVAEYPSLG
jgi:hypothetical protein